VNYTGRTPPPLLIPPVDGRRKSSNTKQRKRSAAVSRLILHITFAPLRGSSLKLTTPSQQVIAKRHRVPLPLSDTSPTDFDLIAALLPTSVPGPSALGAELDNDDERRTATLLLLQLTYAQAQAQLASIAQELELLRSAPPEDPPRASDRAHSSSEAERALWTLDTPRGAGRQGGPLLNSAGKVYVTWICRSMALSFRGSADTHAWKYLRSHCSRSQYYLLA
jgi:TAP42-like family